MTDEELIKQLLDWSEFDEGKINDTRAVAADRIEEYSRAFANLQREYDARGERIEALVKAAFDEGFLAGTQDGWMNNPRMKKEWENSRAALAITDAPLKGDK